MILYDQTAVMWHDMNSENSWTWPNFIRENFGYRDSSGICHSIKSLFIIHPFTSLYILHATRIRYRFWSSQVGTINKTKSIKYCAYSSISSVYNVQIILLNGIPLWYSSYYYRLRGNESTMNPFYFCVKHGIVIIMVSINRSVKCKS